MCCYMKYRMNEVMQKMQESGSCCCSVLHLLVDAGKRMWKSRSHQEEWSRSRWSWFLLHNMIMCVARSDARSSTFSPNMTSSGPESRPAPHISVLGPSPLRYHLCQFSKPLVLGGCIVFSFRDPYRRRGGTKIIRSQIIPDVIHWKDVETLPLIPLKKIL
ncbi:uncharacterized protein V6R79_015375 [Siganus canaliculatus]